jgi:hypothetical protein
MNELIVNADGTVTVVGDAGSVSGILDDIVKANTTPAVLNDDGSIKTEEVVPDADTLAVEVRTTPLEKDDEGKDIPDSRPLLQTHAWRLPKAREDRLEEIRGARNDKLKELDVEYQMADEGVHPTGHTKAQVATSKRVLRDLPVEAKSHLAALNNTDDISAYVPNALK